MPRGNRCQWRHNPTAQRGSCLAVGVSQTADFSCGSGYGVWANGESLPAPRRGNPAKPRVARLCERTLGKRPYVVMNPNGVTYTLAVSIFGNPFGVQTDNTPPFPRVRTKRATLGCVGQPRWGSALVFPLPNRPRPNPLIPRIVLPTIADQAKAVPDFEDRGGMPFFVGLPLHLHFGHFREERRIEPHGNLAPRR